MLAKGRVQVFANGWSAMKRDEQEVASLKGPKDIFFHLYSPLTSPLLSILTCFIVFVLIFCLLFSTFFTFQTLHLGGWGIVSAWGWALFYSPQQLLQRHVTALRWNTGRHVEHVGIFQKLHAELWARSKRVCCRNTIFFLECVFLVNTTFIHCDIYALACVSLFTSRIPVPGRQSLIERAVLTASHFCSCWDYGGRCLFWLPSFSSRQFCQDVKEVAWLFGVPQSSISFQLKQSSLWESGKPSCLQSCWSLWSPFSVSCMKFFFMTGAPGSICTRRAKRKRQWKINGFDKYCTFYWPSYVYACNTRKIILLWQSSMNITCILADGQMDGRPDRQTDGWTDRHGLVY